MYLNLGGILASVVLILSYAVAYPEARPFANVYSKRQTSEATTSLRIDLGYGIYEGMNNATTSIDTWLGIRYAAPPVGALRWQAPQPPVTNRNQTVNATTFGSECPQTSIAGPNRPSRLASEDCLFLDVYSPAGAKSLPVLLYIHGGGYGIGNASGTDPRSLMMTNKNSFIAVVIQYRLGAFGFLSSDEVYRNGVVNAGLLDQHFAMQWTQQYISLFGGDPRQVTIAGQSAGAGSVMLQTMAYGGSQGTSLFTNAIAASVYLPQQYRYSDWQPSQAYYAFAFWAGCVANTAYGHTNRTIFQCLIEQNTTTLQYASFNVSMSGKYGTWGFLPVTDDVFLQDVPSAQLQQRRVNGRHLLVSNAANEAAAYTSPNITTEADLINWIAVTFPLFTNDDIAKLLMYYPSTNASTDRNATTFATTGYGNPSALNQSSFATGQQQRAYNIYAETTFVCPGYWLTEAFTDKGRTAYHYQYSLPAANHGTDLTAIFGPPKVNQPESYDVAIQTVWGNFIRHSNPSIPATLSNGANSSHPHASNPAANWPQFQVYAPYMLDLNTTGGVPYEATGLLTGVPPGNATQYEGPGIMNNFTLANMYTWEAGRGVRCDFWRSVAGITPA